MHDVVSAGAKRSRWGWAGGPCQPLAGPLPRPPVHAQRSTAAAACLQQHWQPLATPLACAPSFSSNVSPIFRSLPSTPGIIATSCCHRSLKSSVGAKESGRGKLATVCFVATGIDWQPGAAQHGRQLLPAARLTRPWRWRGRRSQGQTRYWRLRSRWRNCVWEQRRQQEGRGVAARRRRCCGIERERYDPSPWLTRCVAAVRLRFDRVDGAIHGRRPLRCSRKRGGVLRRGRVPSLCRYMFGFIRLDGAVPHTRPLPLAGGEKGARAGGRDGSLCKGCIRVGKAKRYLQSGHDTTTQHNTTQHNTTQHNTTQHNTTQHNATQRNTTQRNATQRNATQRNATQRNATQRNATQRNATQRNATQRNAMQHNTTTQYRPAARHHT